MQEKSKPVDNLRADAEKIITRAIAAVLPGRGGRARAERQDLFRKGVPRRGGKGRVADGARRPRVFAG